MKLLSMKSRPADDGVALADIGSRALALADADGANRDADACHENRFFSLSFFDGVGRIQGQCGALDFEAVERVFERYQRAE